MTPKNGKNLSSAAMAANDHIAARNFYETPPRAGNNNNLIPMGTEAIDLTATDSPYAIQNPAYDCYEPDVTRSNQGATTGAATTTGGGVGGAMFPLVDLKETEA